MTPEARADLDIAIYQKSLEQGRLEGRASAIVELVRAAFNVLQPDHERIIRAIPTLDHMTTLVTTLGRVATAAEARAYLDLLVAQMEPLLAALEPDSAAANQRARVLATVVGEMDAECCASFSSGFRANAIQDLEALANPEHRRPTGLEASRLGKKHGHTQGRLTAALEFARSRLDVGALRGEAAFYAIVAPEAITTLIRRLARASAAEIHEILDELVAQRSGEDVLLIEYPCVPGPDALDDAFEAELRLVAGVTSYQLRIVPQGLAAEIAGVSRAAFLAALARFGVSPFLEPIEDTPREAPRLDWTDRRHVERWVHHLTPGLRTSIQQLLRRRRSEQWAGELLERCRETGRREGLAAAAIASEALLLARSKLDTVSDADENAIRAIADPAAVLALMVDLGCAASPAEARALLAGLSSRGARS